MRILKFCSYSQKFSPSNVSYNTVCNGKLGGDWRLRLCHFYCEVASYLRPTAWLHRFHIAIMFALQCSYTLLVVIKCSCSWRSHNCKLYPTYTVVSHTHFSSLLLAETCNVLLVITLHRRVVQSIQMIFFDLPSTETTTLSKLSRHVAAVMQSMQNPTHH